MTKHIGIVGCSAEGAALCYQTICLEGEQYFGKYGHPEITMHTLPLNRYMDAIYENDWKSVANLMLESVSKLEQAGADFVISPDNTIHKAFEYVKNETSLPWLHIVEEVVTEAKIKGYSKLGILGTKFTMENDLYSSIITKHGLEYERPIKEDREGISKIIFDELVYGKIILESRDYYNQVISRLKETGCDAVILGCTEIPLLVIPNQSPLPTLDSTRIIARAALKHSIDSAPDP